jgi:polyphenol oxidase
MLKVIHPNWEAPTHVVAKSFTRHGGHSVGPYQGFNCAMHVGDCAAHVRHNRSKLMQQADLPSAPRWLQQVHGHHAINAADIPPDTTTPQADACYTSTIHNVCAVLTADCLPILICHTKQPWVAAVHAGWRGLAQHIIHKTCAKLHDPEELMVWLGPAIGPQAYVVDASIGDHFSQSERQASMQYRDTHWTMDLYALARSQLKQCGVKKVYGGQFCTYTNHQDFYSYRRDAKTGRNVSLIWLEPRSKHEKYI